MVCVCIKNVSRINIPDQKTIDAVHKCNRKENVSSANSKWLANKYCDKIRTDPRWPVESMMAIAQKD